MAIYKIVKVAQLDADLTSIANKIKSLCGMSTSTKLAFPGVFVSNLNNLQTRIMSMIGRTITSLSSNLLCNATVIGEYAFGFCQDLVVVTIPTNITAINGSAFYNCTSLERINIYGSSLTISSTAFRGCTAVTDVYVYSATPFSIGANTFTVSACRIHVPAGTEGTYKAATNWANCADRIVGDL